MKSTHLPAQIFVSLDDEDPDEPIVLIHEEPLDAARAGETVTVGVYRLERTLRLVTSTVVLDTWKEDPTP